ncbi:hypothetical protein ABES25_02130 [Bacillus gobiensis]|uniref:DUF6944 family repetitive protein n=1 Tax=Bacillus gobiensis TaxID=1441095 RepID=UPI003D218138
MDHLLKGLLGSWIQAIGTVLSAIGSTPLQGVDEEFLNNLNLWGNVLQATGNALMADAQETISLEKIGNEIQAIGNTTVIAGMVIEFDEDTKQVLIIKGNFLQALGGGVSLSDELDGRKTLDEVFGIIGNILQIIGNSLQAWGGIYELKEEDGQSLEVNGSWIQAVGAVLSAIGQTKEDSKEISKT